MGWNDIQKDTQSNQEVSFLKIEDKQQVVVRVLSEEPFSRWTHWINSAKRSFTCLGKGCPVCEIIRNDKANGATARYSSQKKHSLLIWNYGTKQIEILEQGNDFFSDLLTFVQDPDLGDLRGYDLKITRKGVKKDTSYTVIPGIKKPICEEALTAFNEAQIDLEKYYSAPSHEQMLGVLEGKPLDEVFKAEQSEQQGSDVDFETE